MAGAVRDGEGGGPPIQVLEGGVPVLGWQEVDLARTLQGLRGDKTFSLGSRPVSVTAATPVAPLTSSVAIANRDGANRVPSTAFVSIGQGARSLVPRISRATAVVANDNRAGASTRSVWRDLFFLAILAATVIGAFWSGRLHGFQKVIVVPGPSSFHSTVT